MEGRGRLGRSLLAALVALATSGCGLLVHGTRSEVPVRSDPSGAEVWVDGRLVGETPLRLRLKSSRDHTVELRRPGYASQTYRLEAHVEAAFVILDIALTGVVGVVVDAATRGWNQLRPYALDVRLARLPAAEARVSEGAAPGGGPGPTEPTAPSVGAEPPVEAPAQGPVEGPEEMPVEVAGPPAPTPPVAPPRSTETAEGLSPPAP